MDFEVVDVKEQEETLNDDQDAEKNQTVDCNDPEDNENTQDEEYDFPLFAAVSKPSHISTVLDTGAVSDEVNGNKTEATERGRATMKTMKISLREASEERIVNERDNTYYFALYTYREKDQFRASAVTFEDVWLWSSQHDDIKPWKVLDVKRHNKKVEKELARDLEMTRKRRARGGLVKRAQRIQIRKRVKARHAVERAIAKAKEEKMMKKRNHKRGGKKHKKKSSVTKDSKSTKA